MNPKTPEYQRHLNERADLREAGREFAKLKDAALEDVSQRFGFPTAGRGITATTAARAAPATSSI